MSENLARKTQKIFASESGTNQLAAFGSMISGTPIYTDDPEVIQTEVYTQGWQAAVANNTAPFMQEDNAVLYGLSYQIAYLLQKGFPEWDENTTYFTNGYCQYNGVPYFSLTDNNIGNNPSTDTTNWQIKRFMDIATDDQAIGGELENVAINPKQLQTSVSNLQSQIDAITSSSDVTDVVGTHTELEAYNTSGLSNNSIIKVLSDETQGGATTYYKWVISGSSGSWELIGQEGPYYTITQSENTFVKKIDYATETTAGIVKVGDGLAISTDGTLEAAAMVTKADIDLSNINQDAKGVIVDSIFPSISDKYIEMKTGASASTYTSPIDGYICIYGTAPQGVAMGDKTFLSISSRDEQDNGTIGIKTYAVIGSTGSAYLPIRKNQVYSVGYGASITISSHKIFYAGNVQE